ncbi:reverse transcriptase domain-containing protein [Tanacetum coccineum]
MITAPEEQEELIVYLAASKEAVSVVLMTKREARQTPIYFVSQTLRGPEVNYTSMEKLVLALVHASKRLRRYFQAHPIIVITDQPIKNILSSPEVAGRMQNWSIQIEEFGIYYRPRVYVKGQVLADFIVERPEEEGLILTDPEGVEFAYALRFQFEATNNEAEYEALIAGLRIAEKIGVQGLQLRTSQQELKEKSVNESEVLAVVEEEWESWMTPIHEYLTDETLPAERKKARAIKQIHEGSCSMHAGTRFIVDKALRIGYYWPTMHKDARALIKACQECQVHKPVPKNPQEKLNPITSPWPFYKWGIDIARPFQEGPGKVKFLIVAMDYFTKWIEAKPVATITGNQVKKFVWENIVCRFGLPGEIISDNGKQF